MSDLKTRLENNYNYVFDEININEFNVKEEFNVEKFKIYTNMDWKYSSRFYKDIAISDPNKRCETLYKDVVEIFF